MLRIQKYLSEKGMCSRREAEELIKRGLVSVNGIIVREMGVRIDPDVDVVNVLPEAAIELGNKKTIVLYKPRDIASSRSKDEGRTVYDMFPQFNELDIVGRLDKASEGLLMLSDDGVVARAVTGAHHGIEKEYVVNVREHINISELKAIESGIELDDGPTLPVTITPLGNRAFSIVLREGRKHQIRRMCEYLHLNVVSLKRVRIGFLTLGDMKPCDFYVLSADELSALKRG